MSLILEALKKSEQQRRLGETPTLGSPVLAASGRRNWLPLLGLLIVVAVAIGWWLLRPAADRAAAPTTVMTTPVAPASPPMARIRDHPAPATAPRATPPKREPANPAAGMGVPAVAPPLPIRPPTTDRPGSATSLRPPSTAPPATPTPVPHATPQLPNAPSSTVVAAAPARTPPAAESATPTAPVAGAPHPTNAPAPTAPPTPALPSVWDLPYATRKALPDLSLTMHVYTPDPKQRFVVIKGDRHVEGDDLGDGVTLKEIRADGMVLDYKGTRFLYPRSGG